MIWLWGFVTAALIVMALTAIVNTLTFFRLRPDGIREFPPVSLLIPARNEAAVIGETVASLLAQEGLNFELIVLDDHSSDATSQLASQAAGGDQRFRLLAGQALPPGWLGKNWACHQLAQQARGEILIFIDADVRWQPGALQAMIALMQREQAGMLSVFPTQVTKTPGERLVVPLLMLAVLAYLPEVLVRRTYWQALTAANGQCLAFTRTAYERSGGHATVRAQIVEDMALARRARSNRIRLVIALGGDLVTCRMYHGWKQVREGFAKNILAGFGGPIFLLLSTLFHWLVFIAPWVWLALGAHGEPASGWPWWPLSLGLLGVGVRALTAAVSGQRVMDAVWLPISVGLMTIIAVQSLYWQLTGGPRWKGRRLSSMREC
jgi:chlorobactene glucosyltransferase